MASILHYSGVNPLIEATKYILHYAGEKFEDNCYENESWLIKSVQNLHPFGTLPVYQEGNRTLNQPIAIARYIATKNDLVPAEAWDAAKIDATVHNICDFWLKISNFILEKDPVKKEAYKKQIIEEVVDYFFSKFEAELKNNKGHFLGKLTWADFILVGVVEITNMYLSTDIEQKYPNVVALLKEIRELPGIKEYIAKRKPWTI